MKEQKSELVNNSELDTAEDKTSPLRCFVSSAIAGIIAFGSYSLLQSIVQTYGTKPITSHNPVVIDLTTAVRTMVMGIVALGTGVFSLAAVGLFLLGVQVTIQSLKKASV